MNVDVTSAATGELTDIVATATRAPSMHNTQPWRFRIIPATDDSIEDAVIEVRGDPSRGLPVADPTGWATRVACGAAVLGVRLGIAVRGHRADVSVLPDPSDPDLIARIRVAGPHSATPEERELHTAIRHRRSNRRPFNDVPAAPGTGARLEAAARAEGAWLDVLDDLQRRADVAAIVREGQDQLNADPAYRAELAAWVRNASEDGVPKNAGGPSPAPYDLLAFRDFGTQPRAPGRDFEPNPLVCVLGTVTDHPGAQVHAGMALHGVLLAATAAGLASSMLSQPIELPDLRSRLRAALGRTGGWPQMVLRFGYGIPTPATPRRPVSDVLEIVPVS
jgi:nitroreductase